MKLLPPARSSRRDLLLLPGIAWLAVFFLVPLGFLGLQSLQSGSFERGYTFTWEFSNFGDAGRRYHEQLLRSFFYAGLATVLALLIAYPLVYWIAFLRGPVAEPVPRAIVAPLFVTYLVRTLAWLNILADEGPLVGVLRHLHVLGARRAGARDVRRRDRWDHLQLPALHGAPDREEPSPTPGCSSSTSQSSSTAPPSSTG